MSQFLPVSRQRVFRGVVTVADVRNKFFLVVCVVALRSVRDLHNVWVWVSRLLAGLWYSIHSRTSREKWRRRSRRNRRTSRRFGLATRSKFCWMCMETLVGGRRLREGAIWRTSSILIYLTGSNSRRTYHTVYIVPSCGIFACAGCVRGVHEREPASVRSPGDGWPTVNRGILICWAFPRSRIKHANCASSTTIRRCYGLRYTCGLGEA